MEPEIGAVSTFLSSYLTDIQPSTSAQFEKALQDDLAKRYLGHWHPTNPEQGSAFRALVCSSLSTLDASVAKAATQAGISDRQLREAFTSSNAQFSLGEDWSMWVDPGCVCLRLDRLNCDRKASLIEVYGRLDQSLNLKSIPISNYLQSQGNKPVTESPFSAGTSATLTDFQHLSPSKRSSKAIQILPPPSRSVSSSDLLTSSPQPSLRLVSQSYPCTIASPQIIPPTPIRLDSGDVQDMFSPSPMNVVNAAASNLITSTAQAPPTLDFGPPLEVRNRLSDEPSRRSLYRGSSVSSMSSNASDDDVLTGNSSDESLSSSITSAGTLWKDSVSFLLGSPKSPSISPFLVRPVVSTLQPVYGFAVPYFGSQHDRSLSSPSLGVATLGLSSSLGATICSSKSAPTSPSTSKPRRRGARGGGGADTPYSQHQVTSSITSISSVLSDTSSSVSLDSLSGKQPTSTVARTREQALAGKLTEHSGGKVGVLGGGVLLGLASGSLGRPGMHESERRKTRERRRGGGQSGRSSPCLFQAEPTYIPFQN